MNELAMILIMLLGSGAMVIGLGTAVAWRVRPVNGVPLRWVGHGRVQSGGAVSLHSAMGESVDDA